MDLFLAPKYCSSIETVKTVLSKSAEIFSVIFEFDEDHSDNLNELMTELTNVNIFMACLTNYYVAKITHLNNFTLEDLTILILHIDQKLKLLNLDNYNMVTIWSHYLIDAISDKVIELQNNEEEYKSVQELLKQYRRYTDFEETILSICQMNPMNFNDLYYESIKDIVSNQLNIIKKHLEQSEPYSYKSTNGIINSYTMLYNEYICGIRQISTEIPLKSIQLLLYKAKIESYKNYSKILNRNDTFVNHNIQILHIINTTIEKIKIDLNKIISDSADYFNDSSFEDEIKEINEEILSIYNDLSDIIHDKLIICFEDCINYSLKYHNCIIASEQNVHRSNDTREQNKTKSIEILEQNKAKSIEILEQNVFNLVEILQKIYNPYLENFGDAIGNTINRRLFEEITTKFQAHLQANICSNAVTLFKLDNAYILSKNIEKLKGDFLSILCTKYKLNTDPIDFVTNLFAYIDQIIRYMLAKSIDSKQEEKYKNHFSKLFNNDKIYKMIYASKCESKSIGTFVKDNGSELTKNVGIFVKDNGSDLLSSSKKVAVDTKTKLTNTVGITYNRISNLNIFDNK
jgi:hypothetical protein